jgi:hypothetical protein
MVRNRQRGAVLINVMILMFFLGALGFAATSMARGNAQTTVSDIRYQQAEWAAEYGLNKAITAVMASECTSSTQANQPLRNKATYSYQTTLSPDNKFCFIRSEGNLRNSEQDPRSVVVKTVTLPLLESSTESNGTGGAAMTLGNISGMGNMIGNVGNNLSNSQLAQKTFVKNDCGAGLAYQTDTCTWCDQVNQNGNDFRGKTREEILNALSQGTPPTSEQAFDIGTFFDANDSNDTLQKIDDEVLQRGTDPNKRPKPKAGSGKPADYCSAIPPGNPPNRNGANCNVLGGGVVNCSGSFGNKIIEPEHCPEGIVLYAESVNVQGTASPAVDMFIAASNNLNITTSMTGIATSRNVMNLNLNANSQLDGIFVGSKSNNNINIGSNTQVKGLISLLNESQNERLNINLQSNNANQAGILGAFFTNFGINNMNINDNSFIEFDADAINKWRSKLSLLKQVGCGEQSTSEEQLATHMVNETKYNAF